LSVYYLDTSALVKLYVYEPGTEQMLRLAVPAGGHTLALLELTRVEFRSAVRQRERAGDVACDIADELIESMDEHLANLFLVQPLTDLVLQEAAALLDRHALRAYDAVQLAGCIMLRARLGRHATFVCSDRQLLKAAADEGIAALNPVVDTEGGH
jgi:predicted nucleic acid-binding protein